MSIEPLQVPLRRRAGGATTAHAPIPLCKGKARVTFYTCIRDTVVSLQGWEVPFRVPERMRSAFQFPFEAGKCLSESLKD